MATKKLVEGFERFRKKFYETSPYLMRKLVKEGASPDFFVINCVDPRNGADIVFDAEPGQQFIRSQMAAIIPPYEEGVPREINASLSYAIDTKKIKHLIIVGHSQCGGCAALVDGTSDHYIESWVKMAKLAKTIAEYKVGTQDQEALRRETERQVVIMSFHHIVEYPMVKQALKEGRLTINAWFFDMDKGTLNEYEPATHSFKLLNVVPPEEQQQPPPRKAQANKHRHPGNTP